METCSIYLRACLGLRHGQDPPNYIPQRRFNFPKGIPVDVRMKHGILDEENKNNSLNPMHEPSHIHQGDLLQIKLNNIIVTAFHSTWNDPNYLSRFTKPSF